MFPKEVFQSSGAKLLQPDYEPKYKAIFREQDLEAGQAIARSVTGESGNWGRGGKHVT